MRSAGSRTRWQNWLAKAIFAGAVFLLPVENASAVANLTFSTTFTPADSARNIPIVVTPYMDQAGTWNGTNDVTNSTTNGDRFRLRVSNTGVGVTDAFDVDITVSLPSGFRLPNTGSTPITVTSPNCNTTTGATDFTPLNASQSGLTIDFNIPANRNIPAGCIYDFDFGITTRNAAPFPSGGSHNITYDLDYRDINNTGPILTASTIQTVQVNPGVLALTKTALTAVATNGSTVDFRIDLRNTGTGGAFRVLLTDTLSANFTGITFVSVNAFNDTTNAPVATPTYVGFPTVAANQLRFNYLPPNVRLEIVVRTTATVDPTATTCPVMVNDATAVQRTTQSSSNFASVEYNLPDSLTLTHDLTPITGSYCELCGIGTVRLTVANTGGISLVNISVTDDLLSSGLTYVPGSTQISLDGGPAVAANDPVVSGANNQILTWSPAQIAQLNRLDSPYATAPPNPVSIQFIYQVRRNTAAGFTEQGLVTAIRNIEARSQYDLICGGPTQNTYSTVDELPIHQPIPQTIKLGRNVDAGQGAGDYAPIIYGHVDDDIIWRVDVQNTGLANMQDLQLDDTITGNFDINYVCNSEAAATAAAAGTPPGVSCVSAGGGNRTSVLNFNVDDPFGNPANDEPATFIDAPAGGNAYLYYVGRIRQFCSNQTNTANIEWGCEVNPPDGGITVPASTGGATPANTITSTADMSTNVVAAGLNVTVAMTGSNQTQPLGTKGIVTITITNNTGGTVRLWNGVDPTVGVDVDPATDDNSDIAGTVSFTDILPTQYVMDRTFVPTAVMAPAYGATYNGMVDSIIHTNPITAPLANTAPRFRLYSSTTDVDPISGTSYRHLIRNGDVLTIQFGVVLVDSSRYDLVADLDVAPEVDPTTDPDNTFNVNNQFTLNALSYCSANPVVPVNQTYAANPEDLDVNTSSALYILTNDPGTPLDLTTIVTNNGGHDADDYAVYVTFGQAMTVQTTPAGCAATSNPPPHPVWNQPAFIPATASVYRCYRNAIAPGASETFTFQVIRSSGTVDDDLTFRADVVGEITLSDGTLLNFPAPASIPDTTPNQQLANNYTLDGIRARVLGFNLTKAQSTTCTEDPPGATPDLLVRIGEDCDYFIHAGGWFGFDTPGFTLISVQDMLVTDALPDGQGFINTDDGATSDMDDPGTPAEVDGLRNITRIPAALPALTEGPVAWSFNQGTTNALTEKDKFFSLNIATRLLNDPVDPLYQPPLPPLTPNVHTATSTNIAHASFVANYESGSVTDSFCISDTANTPTAGCIVPPGYPVEAVRRIDLTITEPNLLVVKEVCNETLQLDGTCDDTDFSASLNDGDTQDMYVYRVTITNEANSGGLARAPAFNVIVTDVLDSSDMMLIDYNRTTGNQAAPFDSDGLDNDGDGLVDVLDLDGEFFSLTENVADGTTPATFVISNTHSVPLQRIDAGASVRFYYRIDPADTVAPLQTLTNTVSTTYDSLAGDSGNQHAPQLTNAENSAPNNTGRARIYDAIDAAASIRILPLQTQPKTVLQTSNTAYTGSPQNVVVGEEVEYQLHAQIPVANLRQFRIRDELPPGIRCFELQAINLSDPPYSDAGFVPGGPPVSTQCTSTGTGDVVEWFFGDQQLTAATGNNLFDFYATFIARVENTTTTQEACNIRNGGSTNDAFGNPNPVPPLVACSTNPTLARLTYVDESGNTITLNYGAADIVVREPVISVTKSIAPVIRSGVEVTDADDVLDVTVTATNGTVANPSTAIAYNLQILDDLTAANMTYVGVAAPPAALSVDTTTFGANQPIFNWANPLALNETISFTFQVRVGQGVNPAVLPHEVLDNTIEARWTSLPNINTALSNGGVGPLDANGTEEGMRNGQFSPEGVPSANPPNDYNASTTDNVVVPELTITKNVIDPATDALIEAVPTIGEHQKFEIVIEFPEGMVGDVVNPVVVEDNLDALAGAGVSYVLESDATYPITYAFSGIEAINGLAANEASFLSRPADEDPGTVTWNIGEVDTLSENDSLGNAIAPRITITYYARIDNQTGYDDGVDLQNNAELRYTNGDETPTAISLTDNTPLITIVEPSLTVAKSCTNETRGSAQCNLAAGAPDAGDVLQYVVTIDNSNGNSTAFDINIRDTIPASVQLDGVFTPTATINAAPVAGFETAPLNTPAGPLIWGRGNTTTLPAGDETLDLPANQTLVLTYRVIVQNTVEPNQIITNSVAVDWTSLNGANVLERTGAGNAACPDAVGAVQAYNDYCVGPITYDTTVVNTNTVNKVVTSDTYSPSGSTVDDGELRIGDTVQYTITLNLQEGTTQNISMVDTLRNGLEFVSIDSVNNDTTAPYNQYGSGDNTVISSPFTYADIAVPLVTNGPGDNTITFAIGDVTNVANNNTADDVFTIVYTARVVDNELEPEPPGPNPAPANATETILNTVAVNYDDVNGPAPAIGSTESITVQQPRITSADIGKVRRNGTPSGTSLTTTDATMDFRLTACNTSGSAPAYDVVLEDILDTPWLLPASVRGPNNGPGVPDVYLDGVLVSNPDTDPTAATDGGANYQYTFNTASPQSTMQFVLTNVAIGPGQCVWVDYNVDVDPAVFVSGNQSWDNTYRVVEYHSLPAPAVREETWGPVGPVIFNMNNYSAAGFTMAKDLVTPGAPYEVTIGETVRYRITVPATPVGFNQYDVTITDDLHDSLIVLNDADIEIDLALSSCDAGAEICSIATRNGVGTDQISFVIDRLEPGEQAVIDVVARVANNTVAQNTVHQINATDFDNTASYTFASSTGGSQIIAANDSTNPTANLSIVEPQLTLQSKTCAPNTNVDAGDIITCTLVINAAGGAIYSDAFDVSIIDTLSLGLLYSGNPTVTDSGAYTNTIVAPVTNGENGVVNPQQLTWSLASGTDIDIVEGGSITVTYQVVVLDETLANQTLSNSATIQWTGIDGVSVYERDGTNTISAQGGLNDYFDGPLTANIVTANSNTISKIKLSDTFNAADDIVRVGDVITYQLDLELQEGTHNNLIVNDILPQGVIFDRVLSIHTDNNGADDFTAAAPFSYADITAAAINVAGDPMTGQTTLSINMGNVVNAGEGDNDPTNNTLSIVYLARILNNNAHAQVNTINPQNFASYSYDTATINETTAVDNYILNLRQPVLSVAKTATQEFGDSIVVAGEDITYTVTVTNSGLAPAYDLVLRDTLPFGMRLAGATTVSITVNGAPVVSPPAPAPVYTYDSNTGVAEWNFDSGVADTYTIQPGQTLQIVYTAEVDATVGAAVTLNNSAVAQVYYSFDDEDVPANAVVTDREDYGPSAAAVYTLTTPAPSPLLKEAPANLNASIGEPFTYRITVPETPVATALYDVQILDNLGTLAPNVELILVDIQKVSGSQSWVPVNDGDLTDDLTDGTETNLVIRDVTTGIDIPAGEQIVIDLTVVLRNTSNNTDGDMFQNTASYTFNSIDNDPDSEVDAGGDSADSMTVVEPLTMVVDKTAPVNMQFGLPGTYTIDVQNTGNGPAFDLTITDHMPDPTTGGGMCDTPPNNFTAVTRDAANVLQQTLAYGTDFTTTFTPGTTLGIETTCTLTITMQSANAVMQSGWHLVVTYDAFLDTDNYNGDMLVNYAAATQWFSANTPAGIREGEIREYNEIFDVTDPGTPSITDHQDQAYTTIQSPELQISKTVYNVATNLYAPSAEPTESLRYEITIRNIGPVAAADFSLSDEIDRLNPLPGFFDSGTLTNVTVVEPDGVHTIVSDPNGGAKGTGLIQIGDLDLTAAGGGGDVLTITFEATLAPVIDSGNLIRNQAEVTLNGFSTLLSDDPALPGIDDPTETIVGSTPRFQVYKISDDITGDANVLQRGDVLVYTITIKNVGEENAINVLLHDQIPGNTTYVPNTTTLNGVFINDPAQGISPLQDGMLINPPSAATGTMLANSDPAFTSNIATVTFNVTVNDNVVNGAVISNQAYVSGEGIGSGGFAEQLSDDPNTDILGDPTRDIVGNVTILDAQKTVVQINDLNGDDLLDAGETIRYTITIQNNGLIDATGVVLTDSVPANTTYIADSLRLNGLPVNQPDGGTLPLIAGIDISSSDLTPPLPASGAGTLSPSETATITFDVRVNAGTADGTVISNQALITSNEYPDELTDSDGNDTNGDQPTLITVGSGQQLTITKHVFVVGGGTAQPGGVLEYLITVTNTGNTPIDLRNMVPDPAPPVFIPNPNFEVLKVMDDVDQLGLISYINGSARLNGVVDANVVYDPPRLIVNFDDGKRATSNFYQFNPGDSFSVRYQVQIDPNAVQGTDINNIAAVDWGTQDFTPVNASTFIRCSGAGQNVDACATSTLAVGGAPGVATLSGKAWHDSNFDLDDQANERPLENWEVQIYFGTGTINPGDYLDSVLTDVNGNFTVNGLVPNDSDTKLYALRFVAPGASTDTASLGTADSIYTDGPQQITLFDVRNSSHTVDMNLPIQPNGVVYNAITRDGVPGTVLQLINASGGVVPASCFADPLQQNQRTLADGYYKFELLFNDAQCPSASEYTINIYPPTGYMDYDSDPLTPEISRIIPPLLPLTDPGYDVPTCTNDATGATPQCEVQTSEFAPATSEAPRTAATNYYLKFNVLNFPTDDQWYNNHLALDPELDSSLAISKTSAMVNVTRSQLVPYTITVTNTLGAPIYDVDVFDDYPAGFKYVANSARIYINNVRVTGRSEEPVSLIQGAQARTLTWENFTIYENDVITIKMLLVVGAGVGEGEYVNRAQARNNRTAGDASGVASATVRVVPDPTFDCSDAVGKVFDDKNLNGYQDEGEPGLPGVRVVTTQGLQVTADEHGRFHIACAVVPNPDRGSNFIVKVDERSLPTGYRMTTENPRVQRATRGKMLKFNFGAAIHRVVRLDMADGVFKPNSSEMRLQWKSRIDLLITELAKDPSILRLSYLAENESEDLVDERIEAIKDIISDRWQSLNCCYKLMIESEVFWRKGGPPDRKVFD